MNEENGALQTGHLFEHFSHFFIQELQNTLMQLSGVVAILTLANR